MRRPPATLRRFLKAYDPAIARLFLAARKAIFTAAPDANELIYDAYNAVAAAYTFTDRLKEAFLHVAAYRDYVNLGFNRGAELADPQRLLNGTGALIRHVRISVASDLERPTIRRLIRSAVELGRGSCDDSRQKPKSIVKAVSTKKRRPSSAKK